LIEHTDRYDRASLIEHTDRYDRASLIEHTPYRPETNLN
jgi:hypothetical protein